MAVRVERIGAATLYLGDCREIAPTLPRPAALVSDPPYGQGYNGIRTGPREGSPCGSALRGGGASDKRLRVDGDDAPFDPSEWTEVAARTVIWGAHRWRPVPARGGLLVWVKRPGMAPAVVGDAEVAWCSVNAPVRCLNYLWSGVCRDARAHVAEDRPGRAGEPNRCHPTQKPVAVMTWCIERAGILAGDTVLDPFMGSGSTGVAALRMGCLFVGIESNAGHFKTACLRIEAAARVAERAAAAWSADGSAT